MTKYSDTEVLYVNLSDEAEALRMRTEANDARIESLQQRLSEVELNPAQSQSSQLPLPQPRHRATSIASAPSKLSPPPRPPKPQLSSETRLRHVEQLNREWQVYNDERERHVAELSARYHETINALRQANEENCRMHSKAAQADQLREENQCLRDKLTRHEDEHERIEATVAMEREKNEQYEADINALNAHIDKIEREHAKMAKALKKDRRRSDMAQLSLEHSIGELTDKLDELSSTGSLDNYTSPSHQLPLHHR